MVFGKLIPREEKFFDLFIEISGLIIDGAREFRDMVVSMQDIEAHAINIKKLESQADEITHHTVELLHKTFITPFDREDIYMLISKLDDILDFIEASAEHVFLYDLTQVPPEMVALADLCLTASNAVKQAVSSLHDLKNPEAILKLCIEIHRVENEADAVLRTAIAKLFREEPDTRLLIKLKEILELLETVTDRCEDVANIIEGILLEYA